MKCGEAIPEDYPVAGADERVGSTDSENETDSSDDLIFYKTHSEIESSGTGDQEVGTCNKLHVHVPIQQQTSRSGRKTVLTNTSLRDTLIW